jgi:type IV pilus assembly protein PilZ
MMSRAQTAQPSAGETIDPFASSGGNSPRPSVVQLVFRDKAALYAAYMPALSHGGLFVPTQREYRLGDDVYLLVALPEDPIRHPVAGRVAWITPAQVSGGRTQGVGVAFPDDEKTRALRSRIESLLGTSVAGARLTQTL